MLSDPSTHTRTLVATYNREQEFLVTEPASRNETSPGMSFYPTLRTNQKTAAQQWPGTPVLLAEWTKLATAVDTLALLPDASQVISSALGTISLWQPDKPKAIAEMPGHTRTIWASAITSDGKILATGAWDRSIRLWDIESRRLRRTIIGHNDIILTILLVMNDRILISGSRDGTIRLWEMPGGRQIRSIRHPGGAVRSLLYFPELDMLAAGADNGCVGLWNVKNGQPVWKTEREEAGQIEKLLVFDTRHLLCLTQHGQIFLLDLNSGSDVSLPTQHTLPAGDAITMNDEIIYTDKKGGLYSWDIQHDRQHLLIQAHQGRITAMTARQELSIMATGGEDHAIKLWKISRS